VVVQLLARPERGAPPKPSMGLGFTATRKVGGAVQRNRCKRRLREAARLLLPELGRPGFDYVFIARQGTAERPWPRLLDDVKSALIRLAAEDGAPGPGYKSAAGRSARTPSKTSPSPTLPSQPSD
jgi:ribonuclease P protein component